jgi:hypothetical protein
MLYFNVHCAQGAMPQLPYAVPQQFYQQQALGAGLQGLQPVGYLGGTLGGGLPPAAANGTLPAAAFPAPGMFVQPQMQAFPPGQARPAQFSGPPKMNGGFF